MKQGKSLTELAQELERQAEIKEDYVVNTPHLRAETDQEGRTALETAGGEIVQAPVQDVPHEQIAERLKIPKRFYDRMRTGHPDLFDHTVNTLLQREPEDRMIRMLDGRVRAFLSNKYRRIDNGDVLQNILPILQQDTSLRVQSCEVTDRRMYLKATTPRIQGEVRQGDVVQSGIVIKNSEVGLGRIMVAPLIYTLACENGAIAQSFGKGKHHVGKALDPEGEVEQLLSSEAKAADDKALMLKLRDIVQAAMDQEMFDKILAGLREAREREVQHPTQAVEKLCQKFNMAALKEPITESFYQNSPRNGYTQYGLLQAVTEYSQQVEDYDKATELEAAGGKIINLPASEWREIATA